MDLGVRVVECHRGSESLCRCSFGHNLVTTWESCTPGLLKVWSPHQQHQHHLVRVWLEIAFSCPTQTYWVRVSGLRAQESVLASSPGDSGATNIENFSCIQDLRATSGNSHCWPARDWKNQTWKRNASSSKIWIPPWNGKLNPESFTSASIPTMRNSSIFCTENEYRLKL